MYGKRVSPGRAGTLTGLLAGAFAGVAAVVLAGAAVAQQVGPTTVEPLLEATHLPPLLTAPGEEIELDYDVYCTPPAGASQSCAASGSVFVRAGGDSGSFRELPLQARSGRLVAAVPADIARSSTGFSYYALVRSDAGGRTLQLPPGGAAAPQRSMPLGRTTAVDLGAQAFGEVARADARVIEASWGDGPGQVGLEQGRNLTPIGGSSFDVDAEGAVSVLDEANRRLLRWRPGSRLAEHVPLQINGTIADLSIADDGTLHVLETTAPAGGDHVLRVFGPDGSTQDQIALAEGSSVMRAGPAGSIVLQQPSGQWTSASVGGRALATSDQQLSGTSARPVAGGGEVTVLRTGDEIRAMAVDANGVRRTWRVTSDTPLAEVQLAEPRGGRLVLVTRVYTDTEAEFLVLVLDRGGVVQQVSLPSADWAETAPLSRFRLVGSSLYQLGSTPAGLFVDRFDLEVE